MKAQGFQGGGVCAAHDDFDVALIRLFDIARPRLSLAAVPPGLVRLTFQQAGGAIGRRAVDATAYPNRYARYWVALASSFKDPSEDEARIAAVREAWKPIEPLTRGFYVNAMSEDMYAKVDANYGPNYARLAQLKRKYDPANQFRLNANVVPAA